MSRYVRKRKGSASGSAYDHARRAQTLKALGRVEAKLYREEIGAQGKEMDGADPVAMRLREIGLQLEAFNERLDTISRKDP